jgi:hypothetical protein
VPTILRINGLTVVIYPNDHRPAHIHVFGTGKEALFYLNCPNGPLTLRSYFRFKLREVNSIAEKLAPHIPELCKAWKEIHGDY